MECKFFFLALLFVHLYSCNKQHEKCKEIRGEKGLLQKRVLFKSDFELSNGNYCIYQYYEDETVKSVESYRNNKLDGMSFSYSQDGGLVQAFDYKEGMLSGVGRKYRNGFVLYETLFYEDTARVSKVLSEFNIVEKRKWGMSIRNYGLDTTVAHEQGVIMYTKNISSLLKGDSFGLDTLETDYFTTNLSDTISIKSNWEFKIDLNTVKYPKGYTYQYGDVRFGRLKGAYDLIDTCAYFKSNLSVKEIGCDLSQIIQHEKGTYSLTGLVRFYVKDDRSGVSLCSRTTFFSQIFVVE
jgi:hypothetical protein